MTSVVGRLSPFHCTLEVPSKFDPITNSVKPGPPASADLGVMPLITGPPPGGSRVELVPVNDELVPVKEVLVPVNDVEVPVNELGNVNEVLDPVKDVDVPVKDVVVPVNEVVLPPGALMVNGVVLDKGPFPFLTLTLTTPGNAISAARITALNCV